MATRSTVRVAGVVLGMTLAASVGVAYIHFPPLTLPKMCHTATHIRVLGVKKFDKEKGVIVFDVVDSLKGRQNTRIKSFRHTVRTDQGGIKPILDWVADGKRAVMFTIEASSIAVTAVSSRSPPATPPEVFTRTASSSLEQVVPGKRTRSGDF